MNPMYELFYKHPEQEGMTYFQHMRRAFSLGGRMLYGCACLVIHGLVPALCEQTGTRVIHGLYEGTVVKRRKAMKNTIECASD